MLYAIKKAEDNSIVDVIEAHNERTALCRYIERHDELEDVMLWKPPIRNYPCGWRVANYDCEDDYLYAEPCTDYELKGFEVKEATIKAEVNEDSHLWELILEQQGGII